MLKQNVTIGSLLTLAVLLGITLLASANGPGGNGPDQEGGTSVFDINEETHLYFMRAEEKLAHDVYSLLGEIYPDYAFTNIEDSETKHIDSMINQLTIFDLVDVNAYDGQGQFSDINYGAYFTEKYQELTQQGQQTSLLLALKAGALIEELDLHDIIYCPEVIVEDAENGIGEVECGLIYTDEKSLINSYNNLLDGSKNHMRAFVRQIEATFPEECPYTAQYLLQDEVDEILGR